MRATKASSAKRQESPMERKTQSSRAHSSVQQASSASKRSLKSNSASSLAGKPTVSSKRTTPTAQPKKASNQPDRKTNPLNSSFSLRSNKPVSSNSTRKPASGGSHKNKVTRSESPDLIVTRNQERKDEKKDSAIDLSINPKDVHDNNAVLIDDEINQDKPLREREDKEKKGALEVPEEIEQVEEETRTMQSITSICLPKQEAEPIHAISSYEIPSDASIKTYEATSETHSQGQAIQASVEQTQSQFTETIITMPRLLATPSKQSKFASKINLESPFSTKRPALTPDKGLTSVLESDGERVMESDNIKESSRFCMPRLSKTPRKQISLESIGEEDEEDCLVIAVNQDARDSKICLLEEEKTLINVPSEIDDAVWEEQQARETVHEWPTYEADKVPRALMKFGRLKSEQFLDESKYRPVVKGAPMPDFDKIREQESFLALLDDFSDHSKLLLTDNLEYTVKDKESGVSLGSDYDLEHQRDHRVAQVLEMLSIDPPIYHERLRACYKLNGLLGDGSFGFVLAGYRYLDGLKIAAKFIRKTNLSYPDVYRHELWGEIPREAYHLLTLEHPGIAALVDYFNEPDYYVVITEMHGAFWTLENPLLSPEKHPNLRKEPCDKPSVGECSSILNLATPDEVQLMKKSAPCDLFECISLHNGLDIRIIRRIFRQTVEAILYLHDRQLVHRDIKDENILIDEDYNIKLIDFGSVGRFASHGDTRNYFANFCGTLHYAAPEIFLDDGYYRGPEQDIWALGVLLYTTVYSTNPFMTEEEIVGKRPCFSKRTDPDLIDLIARCWRMTPEKRLTASQILCHKWMTKAEDELF